MCRHFCDGMRVVALGFGILAGPRQVMAQRPLGTDVSSDQTSSANWVSVNNSGVSFAWVEATQGLVFKNPDFAFDELSAKAAGVVMGAYHYAHYDLNGGTSGADAEANYFWAYASTYVQEDGLTLLPMLELQAPPASGSTAAAVSAWVNEWCNHLVATAGSNGMALQPIIYVNVSFASEWLDSSVTKWPLCMADYNNKSAQTGVPGGTSPWSNWACWQYAGTNWSGGNSDVFNGTSNTLMTAFVVGNVPPVNVTVNAASNATFTVSAHWTNALSYQWQFNQWNISGATGTSFAISNVGPANAGAYSVVVSNVSAALFTATASLSVIAPLTNGPGALLAPANMVDWWPAEGNGGDIFGSNGCTPFYAVSYVPGEEGLAFHFDGQTGFLSNNAASLSVPWTICMWVNRQNAPGLGAALTGDGYSALLLEQSDGTREVGYTEFGIGNFTFGGYVVPASTWTHLCFVGTSAGTSLFVNGTLQTTITNVFPLPRAYIGAAYVAGSFAFADYMLGSLDEIMVFNTALSTTTIHGISAAGHAGVVRAPEFTGMAVLSGGKFQLNLAGITGKNFTIYSSMDLITWSNQATIANTIGTNQYTDNAATGTQTFYRLVQP
jgi:GH25 family lysozyme M1 (1,4-beta-N-acetylmuramidase)